MAQDTRRYDIGGAQLQCVTLELQAGETALGEARKLVCMDAGIAMRTVQADGEPGGAAARNATAPRAVQPLFGTLFSNGAREALRLTFAGPAPGEVLALDLDALGGSLLCRAEAFVCVAPGEAVALSLQAQAGGADAL